MPRSVLFLLNFVYCDCRVISSSQRKGEPTDDHLHLVPGQAIKRDSVRHLCACGDQRNRRPNRDTIDFDVAISQ